MRSFILVVTASAILILVWGVSAHAQARLPVMITSVGQSPDAFTIKVLADRAKLEYKYNPLVNPEELTGVRSLILAVGASMKGFGAAGVNLDTELARGQRLAEAAKKAKITLIVAHIGGEDRREPMSNRLLSAIAPRADLLLVWEEGDKDKFFTKLASERKIPITLIGQVTELPAVLKKTFTK